MAPSMERHLTKHSEQNYKQTKKRLAGSSLSQSLFAILTIKFRLQWNEIS